MSSQQRHLTLQVSNIIGRHAVEIAIPDRSVRILARLDGTNLILQKQLPRSPRRIRPKRDMNIHGLRGPERLRPVNTFQSFTFDGRPDTIASRIRRDRIVRSPSPQNPLREKSLQRYQTKRALRTKIAGVIVANPPCEPRLQLRVSRIVFF